jgi:hypothetical protein
MATVAGEQSMQGRVWLLVFGCSLAAAVMHKTLGCWRAYAEILAVWNSGAARFASPSDWVPVIMSGTGSL